MLPRSKEKTTTDPVRRAPRSRTVEGKNYIRIERHMGELTLRRIPFPEGEISLLRAIDLGEALSVLEEFQPEVVIFDAATLTIEPLELVSALQALRINLRIGCLLDRDRSHRRFGNALWVTSRETFSNKGGPPAKWSAGPLTVGDFVDLAILHRSSVALRFVLQGNRDAEIYFEDGAVKTILTGSTADTEAVLLEIASEIPISTAVHSSCKQYSNNHNIGSGPARKECFMPSLNLKSLAEAEGFIVASLVDSESGMMLGAHGNGAEFGIDIEVASAGNAEFIKTKRKTMAKMGMKDAIEDILVSLGNQYHLFRPLSQNPAYFLYLALDRSRANLAMARHTLKTFDATIKL